MNWSSTRPPAPAIPSLWAQTGPGNGRGGSIENTGSFTKSGKRWSPFWCSPLTGIMMKNNVRILKKTTLTFLLLSAAVTAFAQRQTREEYILKYKHLAAETMERYGIPASIVMAQALLESDNGNSRLARQGNNHFGIKCGGGWNGESLRHDDDAPNECFRVYGDVEESFLDHGRFLDGQPRYDKLFSLKEDDYAAWAHGLRECGYATNPNYGPMLIRIIEENRLFLLDRGVEVAYNDIRTEVQKVEIDAASGTIRVDGYTVLIDRESGRELRRTEEGLFVVTDSGDTMRRLARQYGVRLKKLNRLNPLSADGALYEGQLIRLK